MITRDVPHLRDLSCTGSAFARPHTKKNALEKAVIAINALYTYRDQVVRKKKDPIYESSSLEITMMNAGAAPNVHAAEARFAIDYRMIPSETLEEVSRAILEFWML